VTGGTDGSNPASSSAESPANPMSAAPRRGSGPLDERTREGDDHPARLFLRLLTDRGEKRAMEVIWGNRLKPGDYKYIGGFPHFVADAGDEWVGQWLDERIDLTRVYAEIWKDAAPAHLVDAKQPRYLLMTYLQTHGRLYSRDLRTPRDMETFQGRIGMTSESFLLIIPTGESSPD
jgi:hypothetical protein